MTEEERIDAAGFRFVAPGYFSVRFGEEDEYELALEPRIFGGYNLAVYLWDRGTPDLMVPKLGVAIV